MVLLCGTRDARELNKLNPEQTKTQPNQTPNKRRAYETAKRQDRYTVAPRPQDEEKSQKTIRKKSRKKVQK